MWWIGQTGRSGAHREIIDCVEPARKVTCWRSGYGLHRLSVLAADLVQRRVDMIVTPARLPAFAAKTATSVIPIVFN